jgi:hypothetical protein
MDGWRKLSLSLSLFPLSLPARSRPRRSQSIWLNPFSSGILPRRDGGGGASASCEDSCDERGRAGGRSGVGDVARREVETLKRAKTPAHARLTSVAGPVPPPGREALTVALASMGFSIGPGPGGRGPGALSGASVCAPIGTVHTSQLLIAIPLPFRCVRPRTHSSVHPPCPPPRPLSTASSPPSPSYAFLRRTAPTASKPRPFWTRRSRAGGAAMPWSSWTSAPTGARFR